MTVTSMCLISLLGEVYMGLQLAGRDIWVKTTTKEGKSSVSYHRVWDVGLFLAARERDAAKDGGKVEQVLKPSK